MGLGRNTLLQVKNWQVGFGWNSDLGDVSHNKTDDRTDREREQKVEREIKSQTGRERTLL